MHVCLLYYKYENIIYRLEEHIHCFQNQAVGIQMSPKEIW